MLVSLQYLRALAALLVVYFHATLQYASMGTGETLLPQFGRAGVDLFFVLSGFVMVASTAGRDMSPGEFWHRRATRVLPLYWGVTLFAVMVAIVVPQAVRSIELTWDHVVASFLFVPWPNPALPAGDPDLLSPVVIPGWTLNYEMFFYALFGLTLLARPAHRLWWLAAMIAGSILIGRTFDGDYAIAGFYGSTLLLEFLAGALIASAYGALRAPRGWLIAVFALIGLLCALDWWSPPVDRALLLGVPAALVVMGLAVVERNHGVAANRLGLFLGKASYSIYLTHGFTLAGLRVAVAASGVRLGEGAEILFVVAALVLSALVGGIVCVAFEMPVTRLAARLTSRRAPRRDSGPRVA